MAKVTEQLAYCVDYGNGHTDLAKDAEEASRKVLNHQAQLVTYFYGHREEFVDRVNALQAAVNEYLTNWGNNEPCVWDKDLEKRREQDEKYKLEKTYTDSPLDI